MERRALLSLGVVVLVVLSGCNGLGGGTTTASPSPTEGVTFPGDASRFGLGDVADLGSAHEAALRDANYRASLVVGANLSRRGMGQMNRTVHVGHRDGQRYLRVQDRGEEARDVFLGPKVEYTRFPASGEYRYRYHERGFHDGTATFPWLSPRASDRLVGLLGVGSFTYEGTTERGGTTLLRYEADGVLVSQEGNYTDYSGTLLVSQDGVVHRANGSFVEIGRSGDDEFRQRVTFDWSLETGVDPPEPPDWATELPTLELTVREDGTMVLEHVSGATVPAGTTVEGLITLEGGAPFDVNATLDAELAPGDRASLYVVETDDGYELRASIDPSSAPDSTVRIDGALFSVSADDWWAEVRAPREGVDE